MKQYSRSTIKAQGLFSENRSFLSLADSEVSNFDKGLHIEGRRLEMSVKAQAMINEYKESGYNYIKPLHSKAKKPRQPIWQRFFHENEINAHIIIAEGHDLIDTKLNQLILDLEARYCCEIGYQIQQISSQKERSWWDDKIQALSKNGQLDIDKVRKKRIKELLVHSTEFERFFHKKFIGAKRFSIEGLESLIPLIDYIIDISEDDRVLIGMAHRGRLNVLAQVLNKDVKKIFLETIGIPESKDGDVKYHLGATDKREEKIISLLPNPSHLESINGVLMGRCRRLIDEKHRALAILIHGDSSISGQGVVMEGLNMSGLEGYRIGGTIHVVANNQIGFTTGPKEYKTAGQCTDIAKMIEAPVLHVNAYCIDEIIQASRLVYEYRNKFHKDAFINLIGHRLHGHNEIDEPSFTQPKTYKEIAKYKSISENYVSDATEYNSIKSTYLNYLDAKLKEAKNEAALFKPEDCDIHAQSHLMPRTNLSIKITLGSLIEITKQATTLPEGFKAHPKISRQLSDKLKMASGEQDCDWSMAEFLALGSILRSGMNIRFVGQDVERGTFSHRHAVLIDQENENKHIPLNNISSDARLDIHNSLLSEYCALAFEYGYSSEENTKALTIWEAQFGDFANGAQIVIDQFISSGYQKWRTMSNLVLLLPHGYEGQGPEHSSARLERFLQLCSGNNMYVCNCTTPASFFQLMIRQASSCIPLVVMSPKSLLRHKNAKSHINDMTAPFSSVLKFNSGKKGDKLDRLIFCSGKVFYDIEREVSSSKVANIQIIRLEQLYPFPSTEISHVLAEAVKNGLGQVIWCQEEPENMGAYNFAQPKIAKILQRLKINAEINYIGRPEASSPATGFSKIHEMQQRDLVKRALGIL